VVVLISGGTNSNNLRHYQSLPPSSLNPLFKRV